MAVEGDSDFEQWTAPRGVASSVYHYTSAAGLLGILRSKSLWATEGAGLNDRAEIVQGWRVVHKWLDGQPDSTDTDLLRDAVANLDLVTGANEPTRVFVLSASGRPDDASQWRLYADGGRGYAVELDTSAKLAVTTDRDPAESKPPRERHIDLSPLTDDAHVAPWSRVTYKKSSAIADLEGLSKWAVERFAIADRVYDTDEDPSRSQEALSGAFEDVAAALSRVAHSIKSPGFDAERESRIFANFKLGDRHVRYRVGTAGIVRYLELATATGRSDLQFEKAETRPFLPIRSIRMGPAIDYKVGRAALQSLLRRFEWPDVQVKHSKVKLR